MKRIGAETNGGPYTNLSILDPVRFRFRRALRRSPSLFLPYARRRWGSFHRRHGDALGPVPLDTGIELVIEASPRSGNTFALIAFQMAQQCSVSIGHHTHAPASVLAAVKSGLPTLVIVRQPRDAVISHVIFDTRMTLNEALKDYRDFYARIRSAREGYVLARFETVISDFGGVVERLNERFASAFDPFEHTPENVERAFHLIDERSMGGDGSVIQNVVQRPSSVRASLKLDLSRAYNDPGVRRAREAAELLYWSIAESADI